MVLDLRDNGGGYLTAATDVLSLFMKEDKLLFQMETKNGAIEKYKAKDCQKYNFINGYILVKWKILHQHQKLLQEHYKKKMNYKLVGDQTYGKGTAQTQKTAQ